MATFVGQSVEGGAGACEEVTRGSGAPANARCTGRYDGRRRPVPAGAAGPPAPSGQVAESLLICKT